MMPDTALRSYADTLSRFPMCANEFVHGVRRCVSDQAMKHKHIQINKPWSLDFLAFDIDRWGAAEAHSDAELPAPTFTLVNRENGHAHLLYQLNTPVIVGKNARTKPMNFFKDVDAAMTIQLAADTAYSKVFIKTPGHPAWSTIHTGRKYELAELKEYLTVDTKESRKKLRDIRSAIVPTSRALSLFNLLRKWAYKNVNHHQESGSFDTFQAAARAEAESLCCNTIRLMIPDKRIYPVAEQAKVVASVVTWTWESYTGAKTMDEDEFSELQSVRITKRWGDNTQLRRQASRLRNQGMSHQKIADRLDVQKSTVIRWLK